MHFKKLEFNDIPKVADTLYQYAPNTANDYTVTGLFLWRDLLNAYVAYEEEGLYIYQVVDGWHLFYPPLCGDVAAGIRKITDYCTAHALPYGFYPLTEENMDWIVKAGLPFTVEESEDYNDYLYLKQDLMQFRGRRYHTQKNHLNKFNQTYEDYTFSRITEANIGEVSAFFKAYTESKMQGDISAVEREELIKIPEMLSAMQLYRLTGYCLSIDGKVQAAELGEIAGNVYYSHVEKANREYRGIYTKLVHLIVNDLPESVGLINREEDLGDMGLRQSKRRYRPCGYIEKKMVFVQSEAAAPGGKHELF